MRERFAWGRVFGGQRAQRVSSVGRLALFAAAPAIPVVIVWRRLATALRRGYSLSSLIAAGPVLAAMSLCWAAGEAAGYLTARPFAVGQASRPVRV
jgi:hypothetical protein